MLAVLAASGAVAPATKTALIITIIMVLPVPALPPGSSVEPVVFFARATGFLRLIVGAHFCSS